jgi:carbon-monoxide dehydrogenase catalytic subunit
MVQLAIKPEWRDKAKVPGIKEWHVIARIETGQEMIQRWEMTNLSYLISSALN